MNMNRKIFWWPAWAVCLAGAAVQAAVVLVGSETGSQVSRYTVNDQGVWSPTATPFAQGIYAGLSLTDPIALAQAANRDVYVAEKGGRVLRFSEMGVFQGVVTTLTSRPDQMVVGPDGFLYISSAFTPNNNRVLRVNPATGVATDFITGLNTPRGLDFASNGDLYVARRGDNKIDRFNGTTGALVGTLATMTRPQALYWDEDAARFIVSYGGATQTAFYRSYELDGSYTDVFNTSLLPSTSGRIVLSFLTLGGDIFAADYNDGTIVRVDNVSTRTTVVSGLYQPSSMIRLFDIPVIPEPSAGILVLIGSLALSLWRRCSPRYM